MWTVEKRRTNQFDLLGTLLAFLKLLADTKHLKPTKRQSEYLKARYEIRGKFLENLTS